MTGIAALFAVGPLVAVPVGLGLLPAADGPTISVALRRLAVGGGVAAVLALWLPAGVAAAALAIPWLLVGFVIAAGTARELQTSRRATSGGGAAAAACLVISGAFLVQDRAGLWWPPSLDPVIVRLTAVHFTYAGFVLLLAGTLAAGAGLRLAAAGTLAAAVGIPLTAAGFVGVAPLGLPGALLVAAGGLAIGSGTLAVAGRARPGRRLLRVAGLSLLISMPLAAGYAVTTAMGLPWLDIPGMAAVHGTINVAGFAIPAMLGWQQRTSVRA
ncbi:MAG: YndJ family protein [Chloroflexi bacterium]|nr:YndJ family protein [Chloroflexota bacterium]